MPSTTTGSGTRKAPSVDPVQRALDLVTQSVDEWTSATKSSFDRALAGTYSAEDLAADVSGAVARGVRDWARLFTAAANLLSTVATAPVPGKPEAGDQPAAATRSTRKAAPAKRARS